MAIAAAVGALGVTAPPAAHADGIHKVVLIVLENKTYKQIVGSGQASYLNGLFAEGELFTNYSAVIAGSPHDYRAMTNGLTQGGSDGPNLFRSLEGAGLDWREFSESMTGTCGAGSAGKVPGSNDPLYTHNHDAARMYRTVESCKTDDVPMNDATYDPTELPPFSLVVPNQCDDMHTAPSGGSCPAYFGNATGHGSIAVGDDWLEHVVPDLLAQPDVTMLITFDEGGSGEHVVTVEIGAGVTPGSKDAKAYDHYGLLAGLYAHFGLGKAPNHAANATPLPIP